MVIPMNQVMGKIELNNIPKPSFPTLPDVEIKNTIKLDFNKIFIDDDADNLI